MIDSSISLPHSKYGHFHLLVAKKNIVTAVIQDGDGKTRRTGGFKTSVHKCDVMVMMYTSSIQSMIKMRPLRPSGNLDVFKRRPDCGSLQDEKTVPPTNQLALASIAFLQKCLYL